YRCGTDADRRGRQVSGDDGARAIGPGRDRQRRAPIWRDSHARVRQRRTAASAAPMRARAEQRIFGGIDRTAPRDSLPDGALWDARGVRFKTPGRLHGIAEGESAIARAVPRRIPSVTQGTGVSQRPGALFVGDVLSASEMTPLALIGAPADPTWEPFSITGG